MFKHCNYEVCVLELFRKGAQSLRHKPWREDPAVWRFVLACGPVGPSPALIASRAPYTDSMQQYKAWDAVQVPACYSVSACYRGTKAGRYKATPTPWLITCMLLPKTELSLCTSWRHWEGRRIDPQSTRGKWVANFMLWPLYLRECPRDPLNRRLAES